MDLLKETNEWVQKGFEITYIIINQIENGYSEDVLSGDMPKFTYTFSIYEWQEEIWYYSVDTLEDGFTMSIDWLKKNRE